MPDFDDPVELGTLLRQLAASAPVVSTDLLERRMRTAFRARRRQRRLAIIAAGLVACLLLTLGLTLGWERRLTNRAPVPQQPEYAGFMALPYAESDVPIEQVVIVRVNLRRGDLRALGLPPALLPLRDGASTELVRADLLMGQDGIARAVRVF